MKRRIPARAVLAGGISRHMYGSYDVDVASAFPETVNPAGETTRPSKANMTTTQITVVLTVTHHVDTNPSQSIGAALGKIRDAVHAVADDRYAELTVTDAAVGTAVYGGGR